MALQCGQFLMIYGMVWIISALCSWYVFVQRGNSALHHAAMKGEAEIMKTLIKAGSEINAQDKVPVHVVPVKFLHVL